MKILAGCELYSRNPMVAPARIKDIVWISRRPSITERHAMTTRIIAEIPPARPSSPSIRFTALVIPIIHTKVTIKDTSPISMEIPIGRRITSSETFPTVIKTMAAATSNASLYFGFRLTISSIKPPMNMIVPPIRIPLMVISVFIKTAMHTTKDI